MKSRGNLPMNLKEILKAFGESLTNYVSEALKKRQNQRLFFGGVRIRK